MKKLIDCHAHLISEGVEPKDIIDGMKENNLEAIVCIGTAPWDIEEVVEIAHANKNIFAAVAYHPEYVEKIQSQDMKKLEEIAKDQKVVAIGECGLDYHYTQNNKSEQIDLLKKHIELAIRINKPIMLHIREAEEDAIKTLLPYAKELKNIIIHCYSAVSEEITKKFVEMGCYISFAGNFTFKKYRRQDIKLIPKDKILVETDAPYLSPEPLRGTKNSSKNVHITAERMADELEMNSDELKKILIENAKRVFGI